MLTPAQIAEKMANVEKLLRGPLYTFTPRPDRPEMLDQQTDYIESKSKISFCVGGNFSGKTIASAIKCARFVLHHPAPRHDTPFMVVSDTYRQVGQICWKEKLSTLIPPEYVDWDRATWYSTREALPYTIPLKAHPDQGDRNWCLEFRSLDQGREHFQGRSFGGFWFSEQFEWEILIEVLRGCRDYFFDGAHFCEFTPIDPDLAIAVEEQMDKAPENWKFFRLNSDLNWAVAKEFKDTFFETVSPELLETRRTGAMPTFLGSIYTNFNPAVHVLDDDQWAARFGKPLPGRYCDYAEFKEMMPVGMWYRRALDWGESIEHPFVCLWGFKDGAGNWGIFDEYVEDTGTVLYDARREEIKARWPWLNAHPYFGMTYADPSRPLMIQEFSNDGILTAPAQNSVDNGIEYVRNLLKVNKLTKRSGLAIHKRNCPRLIKELRKYRWLRGVKTGNNPHVARAVPLKWQDDTCFPAGQLVDTPCGARPIETIRAGDHVYAATGIARVDVGATLIAIDETIRLTFSDGRDIICTAEHRIRTSDGRWTEARHCLGKAVLVRCTNGLKSIATESRSSAVSMEALHGDVTRNLRCQITISKETRGRPAVSSKPTNYISRCMSTISDQFQRGLSFITRMRTKETMIQATSNCLSRQNTQEGMSPTFSRRLQRHPNGTPRQKVVNGTGSTALSHTLAGNTGPSIVRNAVSSSGRAIQPRQQDFARTNADMTPALSPKSTISTDLAKSAERFSLSIATRSESLAQNPARPFSVVAINRLTGPVAVYCLATSDGTFFVNGVLVKNCDALRYLCFSDRVDLGEKPMESLFVSGAPDRHGVHGAGRRR